MRKQRLPEEVNLAAQIADLKETDYHNTLILTALIELLIEKGVFTRDELVSKAQFLDRDLEEQIQDQFPSSQQ